MKIPLRFTPASMGLILLLGGASQLRAEITVRLSVKFILNFDGTPPAASGDIGTMAGFSNEVARGNLILAATGRAYKLQVVEYLSIQPPAPAGSNANYWYTLDARSNRATIENAALADQATWRWNGGALNIHVNNSSSGQCSFVGNGSSISLGQSIGTGTVLHEIGHFFNLSHTHSGDLNCSTNPAPYPVADGDRLASTVPDHNCLTQDGLSQATFGMNYAALTAAQQAVVDTSWFNVMSYHQEDRLLDEQMDHWGARANGERLFVCSGRTWFVAAGGFDDHPGDSAGDPLLSLAGGLSRVGSGDDVVLLRAGDYMTAAANGLINTRCTISAARGAVVIRKP